MIITGGSLSESKLALKLAKEHSACRTSHPPFGKVMRIIHNKTYMLPSDATQQDRQTLRKIRVATSKPWMNSSVHT